MTTRRFYKDFPPGWGHLTIPLSSRAAALAGLTLYAACRPTAFRLQRAVWACVKLFGPGVLPGRRFAWNPASEEEWSRLASVWREQLGAFDEVAGYTRRQPGRKGIALLLLQRGTPLAFVKLRKGDRASLVNEENALRAIRRLKPSVFEAPEPVCGETVAGWHYLAVTPLPPTLHHMPASPPLRAILEEVEAGLAELPRPAGTPEHWRPMHGDFAPWNLRQSGPSLFLIDWESAGWGPPGADEVFYHIARAALSGTLPDTSSDSEAIDFWRERLQTPAINARERRLCRGRKAALDHLGRASTS